MPGIDCRTMAEFENALQDAADKNVLVMVDFFATWCGPCRMIAPYLEKLCTEYDCKLMFLKVDVDVAEDVAAKYSIEAMPTFKFIRNKEVVETICGANKDKVRDCIEKNL